MTRRGWDRSGVLLVGHGSASHPESARPILDLAEALRARGLFAEVAAAFMKQPPFLAEVAAAMGPETVHVVPVFAGAGHYTRTLIPRALPAGRRFILCAPAGTHPGIPDLLAERARRRAAQAGMVAADSTLLLIAHGSARPGGAGDTARAIAAKLTLSGRFGQVALVFLEQEPRAAGWPGLVGRADVLALPLLIAQSRHAGRDIPALFGLAPHQVGPVCAHGHRVALATGFGGEPQLADMVIDLVGQAGPNYALAGERAVG